MKLKVLTPTQCILEVETGRVSAEGANGAFVLLPRHIDFFSALVPGILTYEGPPGTEHYVAVDEGILIKVGPEVSVSVRNALTGPDLGHLEATIERQFQALDEQQKKTRAALAKLEADFVRQFMNVGK